MGSVPQRLAFTEPRAGPRGTLPLLQSIWARHFGDTRTAPLLRVQTPRFSSSVLYDLAHLIGEPRLFSAAKPRLFSATLTLKPRVAGLYPTRSVSTYTHSQAARLRPSSVSYAHRSA